MSGSGIDNNFIVMNTFAVLGYFEGLQSYPIIINLDYNSDWTVGTALRINKDGHYSADSFDHLADSPFLIGDLTFARTKVNDIDVEVYVFAIDTAIYAQKILSLANDVLQSSGGFIGHSPVSHYTFLMCLPDVKYYEDNDLIGGGALEHSYSSLYVQPVTEQGLSRLRSTMAHEFMHILTPLNLSSEIIHTYNFSVPTASEHIWLYEGVTEWVSDIMQLRSGLITAEVFLKEFSRKLRINDSFNPEISLSEMSLGVYDDKISNEFFNFYNRGAVTATLLDLRLLELSNGTKGLREVFLELQKMFGKNKPFPETKFFEIIVDMTFPEIKEFVDNYIRGSKPLPYIEYMEKLGFEYISEKISDDTRPSFGTNITVNHNSEIVLVGVGERAEEFGMQNEDIVISVFDEQVTLKSARGILQRMHKMNVGDPYEMVVKRDGIEIVLNCELLQRKTRHVFKELENISDEQKSFRDIWSQNLELNNNQL